jgi:hypothetical protein
MTPAVKRSEADLEPVSVTERAAMTTSVLGRGETSPRNAGAIALDTWQVSWLAGLGVLSAFPVSQWHNGQALSALQSRGRL